VFLKLEWVDKWVLVGVAREIKGKRANGCYKIERATKGNLIPINIINES